ncbi:MAG: flagellar basal body P-ring formation chaperone FlgA [Candidatus Binataceae bacterium]|jgi:flagella basal body P-ring formation protein FlgA
MRSKLSHLDPLAQRGSRPLQRCPIGALLLAPQSLWPTAWQRFLRNRIVRTVVALLGAILLTAVWTYADATAPASADAPTAKAIEAEIAKRLALLMAPGVRIASVKIACPVAAGTTVKDVAPGISRLTSRTFMVELESKSRTRQCSASLEAQRQVMVANRALAAEQPVTAADFSRGWVDAFSGAPGASSDFNFSGPLVTTTFIGAGQPVYPTELAKPVAVRPGDMVTVVVKNGAITVKTALESRSTASIGDSATMLNSETGASVEIRVTGVRAGELVMQ